MEELLKIDEVAKLSGLSKRTIRYYEEIGLLPPPPRSQGGTRLYTQDHVEFLKKITIAKEVLGFSLQELHHFLSLRDTLENQRADYKKVTDPRERKEKLIEIIHLLDDQLQMIEEKIHKIMSVQTELVTLRERARAAIVKIDEELSK
ncbi:merR regulatory family protein [Anoxybacillus sp. B7M1]|jgi:MerR family transcriptional regulator, repressor of the yfmOP operon|uniref:MerR family transcriptional regulator n=1 Tax=unclassified Anoxybacillus TaxID=2639704 RepID=UPI0005CD35F1|nr:MULTISPECIES: MerR family transcriptional regulator [unclassified Anoxybacillus]ANB56010.1 merR regulatory family protein [Anoxybacillus sp. B2M1]ANB63221.1 merR regulatory family protein [Anoxybacillus sp. B7M1]